MAYKKSFGENSSQSGWNSRLKQDRLAGFTHDDDHGSFIGEVLSPIPYVKRIPETIHIVQRPRKRGIVGPETDFSVRTSYIPVGLFHTLLRWIGKQKTYQIFNGYSDIRRDLSPIESARRRPPKGFMSMNLSWTDAQCENWTKLAHRLGITYVDNQHYNVPANLLGHWRGGTHYVKPLPRNLSDLGSLVTVTLPLKVRHKRSFESRVLRSIKRIRKSTVVVKPLDIHDVLASRPIYTRRYINSIFDSSMPISEFRRIQPKCLSLTFGPPLQVSDIVMKSLRDIYSNPKKFLHDHSWIIPKGEVKLQYNLRVRMAPRMEPSHHKRRLIAMLVTYPRREFRAMHTTGANLYVPDYQIGIGKLTKSEKTTTLENRLKWQEKLDANPDDYQPGQVLGGWFD